ncbi:putative immunity protein [Paenibacillus durus]|uniref:putative immunity protein n=1 Tax=Paenibacillus durus TaxID=44251 RepID=UPI00398717F6
MAADCAQHVLHYFEQAQPNDDRPRQSLSVEYRSIWCMNLYNKIGLVFKEVRHGLHFTERSGVKGETVA